MALIAKMGAPGMFSAEQVLMRIGVVTSSYAISPTDTVTAGVFVRDLAYELIALGHEVHVLTPSKRGKAAKTGLSVYYIPWLGGEKDLASASMRNPLTLFRYGTLVASGMWVVSRYARFNNLDVLLAMWTIPSGLFSWVAWKRYGIPYGVWALGSDIWARDKYPLGDRIVRMVLREAGFRFADGVRLAHDVTSIGDAPCEFVPSVRKLPANRESPGVQLPAGVPNFLFVGRYEANKGPDILVDAMRLLLDGGSKAHLHMFGVGSLESCLRKRIEGYEQYIHLGGYADPDTVIAYMTVCGWLVIPSRIESIPLVFIDALQMHLPVIATDVGDLGELVRRFGVGKVVKPSDPCALAAAMQEGFSIFRSQFENAWGEPLKIFDIRQSALRCQENLARLLD